MLLERTLVRTALRGVLAVDEAVVFLPILRRVGKGNVDAFALKVDDGVEAGSRHVVVQQVCKAVARNDAAAVVENGEARVEVGIVAQHVLNKLFVEAEASEEGRVGLEVDVCAVFFARIAFNVLHEFAALELCLVEFSVAVATGHETLAQGVDSFQADTVKTDAGREDGGIVLSTCVQLRNGRNERT